MEREAVWHLLHFPCVFHLRMKCVSSTWYQSNYTQSPIHGFLEVRRWWKMFYGLTFSYTWNKLVNENNPPKIKRHTHTFPLLLHNSISTLHNRFRDDSTRPERHSDSLPLLCEFPLHVSGLPGRWISAGHNESVVTQKIIYPQWTTMYYFLISLK